MPRRYSNEGDPARDRLILQDLTSDVGNEPQLARTVHEDRVLALYRKEGVKATCRGFVGRKDAAEAVTS